jgi:2-methylcitrate dehydratase PrpD
LELTAAQTATALAIAASLSSGLKANFGTMTKPLHIGHCAQNGVMAAMLAREGMTASHDAFEHRQGFFEVFNGAGNYDPDAVLRDWAEPLDIVTPGTAIKRYPCCGSTHPAIDAMLDLVHAHGLTPDNVAHVVSWTHPRRLAHTNRPVLRSGLDAKFSVQYCLARALVDGEVVLSQFDDASYLDARVVEVMARIEAAPHPQKSLASSAHLGAEVTVTPTDGRRLTKAVDIAVGRTSEDPVPPAVLEAKYRDCAGRALTSDAVSRSLDLLAGLEALDHVSTLTDVLAAGCAAEQPDAPTALARAS